MSFSIAFVGKGFDSADLQARYIVETIEIYSLAKTKALQ